MNKETSRVGREADLSSLEYAVLDKLLAGHDPRLRLLREQLEGCRIESREFTGKGFLTELAVLRPARRTPLDIHAGRLDDVLATIDGLEHGAGFLLYITDGELDALEGYSYGEPWPDVIRGFELSYAEGPTRDLRGLEGT